MNSRLNSSIVDSQLDIDKINLRIQSIELTSSLDGLMLTRLKLKPSNLTKIIHMWLFEIYGQTSEWKLPFVPKPVILISHIARVKKIRLLASSQNQTINSIDWTLQLSLYTCVIFIIRYPLKWFVFWPINVSDTCRQTGMLMWHQ